MVTVGSIAITAIPTDAMERLDDMSSAKDGVQAPSKSHQRAPKSRDSDWEPYKDRITILYTAGMPLKKVMETIEAEFGCCAK